MSIQLSDGTGHFTLGASYLGLGAPASIVSADFDGDGMLDLAVASQADDTVTILLGR